MTRTNTSRRFSILLAALATASTGVAAPGATGTHRTQAYTAAQTSSLADLSAPSDTLASASTATGATKSAPVCDGVTDDRAALQSLLDAGYDAVSGKYKPIVVVIPVTPGGCAISGKLDVHSNTRVVQDGLLILKGYSHVVVTQWGLYTIVDNSENVTIEGSGTIDVNRAAHSPSVCCVGGIVTGGPEVGDFNANVKNITIRGLRVINAMNAPVVIDGATNVKVDSVTTDNSGNSFTIGHNSHNISATRLRITNVQDIGFAFYRGAHNAVLSDSVISDVRDSGISVYTDTPAGLATGPYSSNIAITGNVVHNSGAGIDVNGLGEQASRNVNISGNVVHHNKKGGVFLSPCNDCQVVGNLIHDNGHASINYVAGIGISHSGGINVASNTIYNEGQGTTTGLGIAVTDFMAGQPATSRLTVTANNIYDSQASKTMTSAFGGGTTNPVSFTGNTLGAMLLVRDAFSYAAGSISSNNNVP